MLPLNWLWKYTDKLFSFTKDQKVFDDNGRRIREWTLDYV
jgi:hypothetical protein